MIRYIDTFTRPDTTVAFYESNEAEMACFQAYPSVWIEVLDINELTRKIVSYWPDQTTLDTALADANVQKFIKNRDAYCNKFGIVRDTVRNDSVR